jgi:hypothetical protein
MTRTIFKYSLIALTLIISSHAEAQRISDMPLYTGPGDSMYVPVVIPGISGSNRKMYGKDLSKNRIDSVVNALTGIGAIGTAPKPLLTTISELRALTNPLTTDRYYTSDLGKEGFWYYDATDVSSADNTGTVLVSGSKRYKRVFGGAINLSWFGLSTVSNNSPALIAAKAVNAGTKRTIYIPGGSWPFTDSILLTSTDRGLTITGDGQSTASTSVTNLIWNGTGSLFSMGSPDGHPEDSAGYNGVQNVELSHLRISGSSGTTADVNGNSTTYYVGRTGITDNRGGSLILNDVTIYQMENGYYGYNADFNQWNNVHIYYCKRGAYIGPRSDQGVYTGLEILGCATALEIKSATGLSFIGLRSIINGSTTTPHIKIWNGTSTLTSKAITFVNPWIEQDGASAIGIVDGVFEIGLSSTNTVGNVSIINAYFSSVKSTDVGALTSFNSFISCDNVTNIQVDNPDGLGWSKLNTSYVKASGTHSGVIEMRGSKTQLLNSKLTNGGSGSPQVLITYHEGNGFRIMRDHGLIVSRLGVSGLDATTFGTNITAVFANSGNSNSGIWVTGADNQNVNLYAGKLADPTQYRINFDRQNDEMSFLLGGNTSMKATNKGFIPRLLGTSARDALTSVSEGSIIHNTSTHAPNYYDGTSWRDLSSASDLQTGTVPDARLGSDIMRLATNQTVTSKKTYNGSFTASAGISQGMIINTSHTATANNDVLVNMDVIGSFVPGSFTGVTSYAARFQNSILMSTGTANLAGSISQFGGGFFIDRSGILIRPYNAATAKFVNNAATAGISLYNSGNIAVGNVGGTDNNSNIQTGSISVGFVAKTTAYTLTTSDHTATGDATSAAFSLTLPTAVNCAGREYIIKKIDASANAVTVATTSSQTIDGSTTYALSTQWKYVSVQSNGSNWIIVGNN